MSDTHNYTRAAVVDIETTGLTWDDHILCVGVCLRERSPKQITAHKVFQSKPGKSPSELVNRVGAASITEQFTDGWMHTSFSVNINMVDLFTRADPVPEARRKIQTILREADWIIGHNLAFDFPYLLDLQLISYEQLKDKVFDTMSMARCTGPHNSLSLENLLDDFNIRVDGEFSDMKDKRNRLAKEDPDRVLHYVRSDVHYGMRLFVEIWPLAVEQYSADWIRKEGNYVRLVSKMRYDGSALNLAYIHELWDKKAKELDEIGKRLLRTGIKGPNAKKSLWKYIKGHGYFVPTSQHNNPILDEDALLGLPGVAEYRTILENGVEEDTAARYEELKSGGFAPTIHDVLEARHLEKQISTWLVGFLRHTDKRGRIHPLYAPTTISNRLSCKQPNAQAVEKGLNVWGLEQGEDGHEPEWKYLLVLDYSQAEIYWLTAITVENAIAEMLMSGKDFHYETAVLMFVGQAITKFLRTIAKRCNFGSIYGGGAKALDEATGIGRGKATQVIATWRGVYPRLARTSKKAEEVWLKRGYLVLAHGKRVYASDLDKQRVYKAFNALIQGGIAEIIKEAMLTVEALTDQVRIVGQTHDSLLIEMKDRKWAQPIMELMVNAAPRDILDRTTPKLHMKVDGYLMHLDGTKEELEYQYREKTVKPNKQEVISHATVAV